MSKNKKLEEGVLGGMQKIEATSAYREENDMDKWMKIVSEAESTTRSLTESEDLNQVVAGDYSNGYGDHHSVSKKHSDYFPNGADSNVVDKVGPSGAKQGDNPMQKAMKVSKKDEIEESAEIHKELVYAYRDFLREGK